MNPSEHFDFVHPGREIDSRSVAERDEVMPRNDTSLRNEESPTANQLAVGVHAPNRKGIL
jgi:hypothetical protein